MAVEIVLSIHLVAVAFAYGAGFAGGETGRVIARAAPEMREPLWKLLFFFFKVKAGAFVVLVVAGFGNLWLMGMNPFDRDWIFWLKMFAVAASVLTTSLEISFALRWQRGDDDAFRIVQGVGHLTGLAMTTAIVAAVFSS